MAWAPDYCTVGELEDFRRISDDVDATELALAISAASRSIDQFCNRQFGQLSGVQEWFYTPRYDKEERRWYVQIDDVQTSTGLLVDTDTNNDDSYSTNLTDYILRPRNATDMGNTWTEVYFVGSVPPRRTDSVRVTAQFGWTTVPNTIKQACLLQANRLATRRDAPFGVAGSPSDGSEIRLLAKLDPDVMVSLRPYKRMWGAV